MAKHPPMDPATEMLQGTTVLAAAFGAILVFALFAARSIHSCHGDGCIGRVLIPAGVALVGLGVQLFVLIPGDAVRRSLADRPWRLRAGLWAAASIAAFGAPLLLAR